MTEPLTWSTRQTAGGFYSVQSNGTTVLQSEEINVIELDTLDGVLDPIWQPQYERGRYVDADNPGSRLGKVITDAMATEDDPTQVAKAWRGEYSGALTLPSSDSVGAPMRWGSANYGAFDPTDSVENYWLFRPVEVAPNGEIAGEFYVWTGWFSGSPESYEKPVGNLPVPFRVASQPSLTGVTWSYEPEFVVSDYSSMRSASAGFGFGSMVGVPNVDVTPPQTPPSRWRYVNDCAELEDTSFNSPLDMYPTTIRGYDDSLLLNGHFASSALYSRSLTRVDSGETMRSWNGAFPTSPSPWVTIGRHYLHRTAFDDVTGQATVRIGVSGGPYDIDFWSGPIEWRLVYADADGDGGALVSGSITDVSSSGDTLAEVLDVTISRPSSNEPGWYITLQIEDFTDDPYMPAEANPYYGGAIWGELCPFVMAHGIQRRGAPFICPGLAYTVPGN